MSVARRITAGGVELCVEERGRGSAVVLLHGFAGCARDLDELAEGLAGRHRVVSIDLVGHGRSDAPRALEPYTMECCTRQVLEVLGATRAAPAHLFGYSMGGRIALATALRQPGALRSLALLGASAGLAEAAAREERRRSDEALAARIEREGIAAFVDFWSALPLFATQRERLSAAARASLRERRLANRPHALAAALRGMGTGAQPAYHDRLPELELPVWLGHGADDAKFAAIAAGLARRLPRAECAAIPAAGHAAHLENPEAVRRALLGFFERAERRAPAPSPTPRREAEPARLRPDEGALR